jgi:hypothetical protein
MTPKNSIGKEKAIELYNSNWWEGLSYMDFLPGGLTGNN